MESPAVFGITPPGVNLISLVISRYWQLIEVRCIASIFNALWSNDCAKQGD